VSIARTLKISEFCKTGSGGTPSRKMPSYYENGNIPWVKSGELRENLILDTGEKITEEALQKSSAKIVPKGSLLLAMYGATVGRLAFLGIDAATNQAVCNIQPDEKICFPKYLYYALLRKVPEFLNMATGGAQPNISQGLIKDTKILLPTVEEQKRIAAALDKADAIRRKRQQAIDLTDQLLRSVFLDMFGDPVNNPKSFEHGKIGNLLERVNYGTSAKAGKEGKYPILRMNNITYGGGWKLDDLKYIDMDERELKKYTAEPGDILFNRTNSKELVGKTAVFRENTPYVFAGYLVRSKVNSLATPEYISGYLNSTHGKMTLQSMCKNIVGMANINAKEYQAINILIPPIEDQRKYSSIVEYCRNKTSSYQGMLEKTNDLFNALSQRAFKGELH